MHLGLGVPARSETLVDFAAVGEGGVDIVSMVDGLPAFDEKTAASDRCVLPGGQSATAAVGVARLGCRARWIGVTGDDDWGRMLRDALHNDGVDVVAPARPSTATRSAVVFVDNSTGRRAVIEYRDPALDAAAQELSEDAICSARIVLVDGTDLQLGIRAATAARRSGLRTMVDLDRDSPRAMELLSEIDIVILPEALVRSLSGIDSIGEATSRLGRLLHGAALVVATLGSEGALGWCRGEETSVPAYRVEVRDTTGAGDAFRAGFAARWLATADAGADVPDLLEYASLVAALSCRQIGAQAGLPTAEQVARARHAGV